MNTHDPGAGTSRRLGITEIVATLAVVAALVMLGQSFVDPGAAQSWRTAAIVVFAIGLFATHVIPEYLTSLMVLFAAVAFGIAPNDVVFSGFTVGGLWLLFSGIIIGAAVGEAGLGAYIARRMLGRIELTYPRAIVLTILVASLMGFVMPATIPRIIILMPIALGLAEAMGYEEGGPGYTGLAIAVGAGTFFPTFAIMTANLPTVVQVSAMETLYGNAPAFATFFAYHLPVSILRGVVLMAILLVLFRQPARATELAESGEPMTAQQRRLLAVLVTALALWITDFIHGIAPAWVALGAAITVLLPPMRLLKPSAFKERIDLSPVLYIAGVLCIGAVMQHSGLDARLGNAVVNGFGLSEGQPFASFMSTFAIAVLMCLVMTVAAVPVMLVPLARQIADTTGLDLGAVLMTQFLGLTTMIFPYQGPPLVVALSLCKIRVSDLTKVLALLAVAVAVIGAPMTYVWWQFLGLLR